MPQRFTKETLGSYTFSSLTIGREQHVPDSSNHSLYLMKLSSCSCPEGSSGGNQQADGSISLSPSPPLLPPQPEQHTTRNTQRQRHRDSERHTDTETKPKYNDRLARQTLSMMFG